jgi:HD-GYP domain-containing protein (c-di-GMP phosphodiesterase class II)
MNILLLHPQKETRDMLSFCLESELGATVQTIPNFQSAADFFLGDSEVHLVIAPTNDDSDKLFKYMLSTQAEVFVVLLSEDVNEPQDAYSNLKVLAKLRQSEAAQKLPPLVKDQFRKVMQSQVNEAYCRIEPSLLLRVVPLRGDVFIRISSVKFVKLFRNGTTFTKSDLERVTVKKKVTALYIKKNETQEFIRKFKIELESIIAISTPGTKEHSDQTLINTAIEIQEVVQELTSRLGFPPEIREIAQQNVRLTLNAIGSSPNLSVALEASQFKNKNYISSHSIMLAYLTCSIAAQMKWPSDTTFQKLTFASLFHDLSLTDAAHAKVQTKQQLQGWAGTGLGDAYEAIKSHTQRGAEMVQKLKEIPSDVDTILLQHHERPDGSGWPAGLRSQQIAPLSAVFIVAHDMVDALITQKNAFTLDEFLKQNEAIYQLGTFRKIWKALANYQDGVSNHESDTPAA